MTAFNGPCPADCRCGRHRGSRRPGPAEDVALFRRRFFEQVPPPYYCTHCGEPVTADGYWRDAGYLVLQRRDGNPRNTAAGNLAPAHRACVLTAAQQLKRECECGKVMRPLNMEQHRRRTGHQLKEPERALP